MCFSPSIFKTATLCEWFPICKRAPNPSRKVAWNEKWGINATCRRTAVVTARHKIMQLLQALRHDFLNYANITMLVMQYTGLRNNKSQVIGSLTFVINFNQSQVRGIKVSAITNTYTYFHEKLSYTYFNGSGRNRMPNSNSSAHGFPDTWQPITESECWSLRTCLLTKTSVLLSSYM